MVAAYGLEQSTVIWRFPFQRDFSAVSCSSMGKYLFEPDGEGVGAGEDVSFLLGISDDLLRLYKANHSTCFSSRQGRIQEHYRNGSSSRL